MYIGNVLSFENLTNNVGVLVVSIMSFDNVTGGAKLYSIREFLNQNL